MIRKSSMSPKIPSSISGMRSNGMTRYSSAASVNMTKRNRNIHSSPLCETTAETQCRSSVGTSRADWYHYTHIYWQHIILGILTSVLWRCWLGGKKGIRPVKNWLVRYKRGYLSEARCKWFAYGPADATATPPSPAPVKSRMVYLIWCRLTQVVLETMLLNGRSSYSKQLSHAIQFWLLNKNQNSICSNSSKMIWHWDQLLITKLVTGNSPEKKMIQNSTTNSQSLSISSFQSWSL